jgi:hypothetical protein
MKQTMIIVTTIFWISFLNCIPVAETLASQVAQHQLTSMNRLPESLRDCEVWSDYGIPLAYAYSLSPRGYIIISADDALPPVIAYSNTGTLASGSVNSNPLRSMVVADLSLRLQNQEQIAPAIRDIHRTRWTALLNGSMHRPDQWPPAGSTSTEGWVETEWGQGAPYNNMCPLDLASGDRPWAGCPSVAMAQILNYHKADNHTRFNDTDAYRHNYGQVYWIDADAETYDFPTFEEMNGYLDTLETHWSYQQPLTNTDKAALIFAAGLACHQVWSTEGSGTFGVDQAYTAYQRFGFTSAALLTDEADLFDRLAQNMRDGHPAHYAIITPDGQSGHNVVVDGYNSDGYFHVNFGWTGSYDGWYLLPSELPYGLTVTEGVVLDIVPDVYVSVYPAALDFQTLESIEEHPSITLVNLYSEAITIDSLFITPNYPLYQVEPSMPLPAVLQAGEELSITVYPILPVTVASRDTLLSVLYIAHSLGAESVSLTVNESLIVSADDGIQPLSGMALSMGPNPFSASSTISYSLARPGNVDVRFYDLRGRVVRHSLNTGQPAGKHTLTWNGTDDYNRSLPTGVYLCRVTVNGHTATKRLMLLR